MIRRIAFGLASLALMGQASPSPRPHSLWLSQRDPGAACAPWATEWSPSPQYPLDCMDVDGQQVLVKDGRLGSHPFLIGYLHEPLIPVFDHVPGFVLVWDSVDHRWLWAVDRQVAITPGVEPQESNLEEELFSVEQKMKGMVEVGGKPPGQRGPNFDQAESWACGVLPNIPIDKLEFFASPNGLSAVLPPLDSVPTAPRWYSPYLCPVRMNGDWIQVVPAEHLGFAGQGKYPPVSDAYVEWVHWRKDLKGWIRWREDGPVPGSKRLLVRDGW